MSGDIQSLCFFLTPRSTCRRRDGASGLWRSRSARHQWNKRPPETRRWQRQTSVHVLGRSRRVSSRLPACPVCRCRCRCRCKAGAGAAQANRAANSRTESTSNSAWKVTCVLTFFPHQPRSHPYLPPLSPFPCHSRPSANSTPLRPITNAAQHGVVD